MIDRDQAERAVEQARRRLGLRGDLDLVAINKQAVFRLQYQPHSRAEPQTVAVRVYSPDADVGQLAREEANVRAFMDVGAPVVSELRRAIWTPSGRVSVWEWAAPDPGQQSNVSMGNFGELAGRLHSSGARLLSHEGASAETVRNLPALRQLVLQEGHPLFGRSDLVEAFANSLTKVMKRIDELPDAWDPSTYVPLHGDFGFSNILDTPVGLRSVDHDCSGMGPPGWDFALAGVGMRRMGVPFVGWEQMVEGYGRGAPAFEEVLPYIHARELKFLMFAMLRADREGFADELRKRLPILDDPECSTPQWDPRRFARQSQPDANSA